MGDILSRRKCGYEWIDPPSSAKFLSIGTMYAELWTNGPLAGLRCLTLVISNCVVLGTSLPPRSPSSGCLFGLGSNSQ